MNIKASIGIIHKYRKEADQRQKPFLLAITSLNINVREKKKADTTPNIIACILFDNLFIIQFILTLSMDNL
ncbi:hypothetical protein [Leuconostoc mesenteroides]|uniref:hypothetical protein n=1 Tax=Leuconostoc mesenteroides TaxID=1245 RepID=UPI0023605F0E|nr:hypothetical protein [Leuconostoc mesenteroides]